MIKNVVDDLRKCMASKKNMLAQRNKPSAILSLVEGLAHTERVVAQKSSLYNAGH
jgi:hypothetical protein